MHRIRVDGSPNHWSRSMTHKGWIQSRRPPTAFTAVAMATGDAVTEVSDWCWTPIAGQHVTETAAGADAPQVATTTWARDTVSRLCGTAVPCMFVPLHDLLMLGTAHFEGMKEGIPFKDTPRGAIIGEQMISDTIGLHASVGSCFGLQGMGSNFSSCLQGESSFFSPRCLRYKVLLYFFIKSSGTCLPSLV